MYNVHVHDVDGISLLFKSVQLKFTLDAQPWELGMVGLRSFVASQLCPALHDHYARCVLRYMKTHVHIAHYIALR